MNVKDDRGFNQGFKMTGSTVIRMKRRSDYIVSKFRENEAESVLEIGCGRGEISYWIARDTHKQTLGTDLCESFIENAKKTYILPNLKYSVVDFNREDDIPQSSFDYIIGNGILHHLYHSLDESLTTMRKILKVNGKIIFIEPNIYNPYIALIFKNRLGRKLANLEPDEMAFSDTFIKGKLERNGYRDIHVEFRDFLLPGLPNWMVRPSIALGNVLEKIPMINRVSQSIFIHATK